MIKVLGSKQVNVQEFLNDISKSREKTFLWTLSEVNGPTYFQEIVDSPDHRDWLDVMSNEIHSMARNNIHELIDLSP